jgi:hypothetical protein
VRERERERNRVAKGLLGSLKAMCVFLFDPAKSSEKSKTASPELLLLYLISFFLRSYWS